VGGGVRAPELGSVGWALFFFFRQIKIRKRPNKNLPSKKSAMRAPDPRVRPAPVCLLALALLPLLCPGPVAAQESVDTGCVSGQLPRRCTVGTGVGTAYSAALQPSLPSVFDQGGTSIEQPRHALISGPTGTAVSVTQGLLYVAEAGRSVIRALNMATGVWRGHMWEGAIRNCHFFFGSCLVSLGHPVRLCPAPPPPAAPVIVTCTGGCFPRPRCGRLSW
jgi:hypothetical protein